MTPEALVTGSAAPKRQQELADTAAARFVPWRASQRAQLGAAEARGIAQVGGAARIGAACAETVAARASIAMRG